MVLQKTGGITFTYAVSPGGPLVQKKVAASTSTRYLIRDAHGDVVGLTKAVDGTVAGTSSFSPWGEPRAKTGDSSTLGFQADPTDPTTAAVSVGQPS